MGQDSPNCVNCKTKEYRARRSYEEEREEKMQTTQNQCNVQSEKSPSRKPGDGGISCFKVDCSWETKDDLDIIIPKPYTLYYISPIMLLLSSNTTGSPGP